MFADAESVVFRPYGTRCLRWVCSRACCWDNPLVYFEEERRVQHAMDHRGDSCSLVACRSGDLIHCWWISPSSSCGRRLHHFDERVQWQADWAFIGSKPEQKHTYLRVPTHHAELQSHRFSLWARSRTNIPSLPGWDACIS